jgi:hypothetical protein
MKVTAKEVIGFVSGQMGISVEEARDALCATDKEMIIELESVTGKDYYDHVINHDLDIRKVDLKTIAQKLGLPMNEFSTYVEDRMIWIVYGPNIVEGIVGEGPTPKLATAAFYRQWYKDKIAGH